MFPEKEKVNLNNEMYQFQNEVLKMVRQTESKLNNKINDINKDTISKIEAIIGKLNNNEGDIGIIKDLFTNNKVKLEKLEEFDGFRKKVDNIIITHEIRINKVINDAKGIEMKFDKMITNNLYLPGYIGPNCKYKNLAEYLKFNFQESSRIKTDKEKFKSDIDGLRIKMDNQYRNLQTVIEANINRNNIIINKKQDDFKNQMERKFEAINEKIIELKMKDIQFKLDNEKNAQDIEDCLNKINEINTRIEQIEEKIKQNSETKNKNGDLESNSLNKSRLDPKHKTFKGKFLGKLDNKDEDFYSQDKKVSLNNTINKTIDNIITEKEEEKKKEIISLNVKIKSFNDNYNLELKSIKNNIKDINAKIQKIFSFLDKIENEFNFNTIKPIIKDKNKKESGLQNNMNNENARKALSENRSEENFRNILVYQYNKTNNDKSNNKKYISKIYDVGKFANFKKENHTFVRTHSHKGYQSHKIVTNNMLKKYLINTESENNLRNQILQNKKKPGLKENDSPLERKIMDTVNYIIKENKLIKEKLKVENCKEETKDSKDKSILPNNLSLSNNGISNYLTEKKNATLDVKKSKNRIEIFTDKQKELKDSIKINKPSSSQAFRNKKLVLSYDKTFEPKSKQYVSPVVDKLYKDYFNKNQNRENKLNINNKKKILSPHKIISVFGKTFYKPISEQKRETFE